MALSAVSTTKRLANNPRAMARRMLGSSSTMRTRTRPDEGLVCELLPRATEDTGSTSFVKPITNSLKSTCRVEARPAKLEPGRCCAAPEGFHDVS